MCAAMLLNDRHISVPFSEDALRKRNVQLSIMLDLSNYLSTIRDLDDLLGGALSKVMEIFRMEAGRIYLMDDAGQFLHLAAHQGIEPLGLERIHIKEGFSGKSARTRAFIAQHISELEDRERVKLLSGQRLQIIICVPLIARDTVCGVMNLATGRTVTLDQDQVDLLTTIGNQIAVAVDNRRLYGEIKRRMEDVERKKEMIKFFTYSVSHDLKSPATSLYALAARFQQRHAHQLDKKGKALCGQILKTSRLMLDLVEKINEFVVSKEATLRLEKISLKEITDAVKMETSSLLKHRKITWSEPPVLPEIVADRTAISRVLRNLVDNALKYGGDRMYEIQITYRDDGAFHTISVKDNGVGIAAEEKEKIFDPFQRSGTSRGQSGAGLGLAIVRETARRHLGNAWLETDPGGGAVFSFSIRKDLEAAQ